MTEKTLSDAGLDLVFREARTFNAWAPRPVSTALMQAVYDLAKMGPTSANCSPARFVFLASPEAKARLKPHVSQGNLEKTMRAPITVIIGHDLDFAEKLPDLFPHAPDANTWFADPEVGALTAFRNGSLQGAYFMLAARSLGLDCGPMSGFDNAGVDAEFFPSGRVKSNFLCNIGYGDPAKNFPRSPRLDFEEACQIL